MFYAVSQASPGRPAAAAAAAAEMEALKLIGSVS